MPLGASLLYRPTGTHKVSQGAAHKERPHSGGRGIPARTFFGQGVLQMRTSALIDAKKLRIFRNAWCVRTDKGTG